MLSANKHTPITSQLTNEKPDHVLKLYREPDDVERVWLLSIRHSGTHYTYAPLIKMGYEQCIVFWDEMKQKNTTGKKQFIHAHLEVGHEYAIHLTDEKVVIPLRNPIEVFRTHTYRYRWAEEIFVPHLLDAFERFDHVVNNYNSFIFQVDAEDQELEFNKLASFLGTNEGMYEEQERTVATSRTRPVTLHQGFTETQVKLFNNPPKEILELANQYGY